MSTAANHLAAARARLAHLGGLSARTTETERRVLDAAEERLAVVLADLERLRPRINTNPDAADRYQALTLESGQLRTVIGRAQQVLT